MNSVKLRIFFFFRVASFILTGQEAHGEPLPPRLGVGGAGWGGGVGSGSGSGTKKTILG